MHRKQPIAILLYNYLYPHPRPTDPISFSAHLAKNLVPEVRIETATFYGSLDTIEARYPGLNYSHLPHRKRLGRFPHHAALFKAFDALALTEGEIAGFCRWEGTKWARERYERDEGIKVQDTTGLDIPEWVDPRKTKKARVESPTVNKKGSDGIHIKRETTVEIQRIQHGRVDTEMRDDEDHEDEEDDDLEDAAEEEEDTLTEPRQPHSGSTNTFAATSTDGRPLIRSRAEWEQAAVEAIQSQAAGLDLSVWEQWMKDATESGTFSQLSSAELARQRGLLLSNHAASAPGQLPSTTNPRMGSPRA